MLNNMTHLPLHSIYSMEGQMTKGEVIMKKIAAKRLPWVSITDRKPDRLSSVLVWTRRKTWYKATFEDGKFWLCFGRGVIDDITHWCYVTDPVDQHIKESAAS